MLPLLVGAILFVACGVRAETDSQAREILNSIQEGKNNQHQIKTLRVRDGIELPAGSVDAADLDSAVQDMVVNSFTAVAVPNANGGTNVVTVTAKDMGGATLAARTMFTCFLSLTSYGAPSADCVSEGDFVVSNGVEVEQRVDKAVYDVMTGADGIVTLTINDTPGVTNYLHTVSAGGVVTSTPLYYNLP